MNDARGLSDNAVVTNIEGKFTMATDEEREMQLAIELSKKSFEEEQAKRNRRSRVEPETAPAPQEDLISFENPGEKERRQKVENIKRLYSQSSVDNTTSSNYGWNPEVIYATHNVNIPSSSSFPILQSASLPNSGFSHFPPLSCQLQPQYQQQLQQLPQQLPPPIPPKIPQHTHVTGPGIPPPLPPRRNPPSRKSSISSYLIPNSQLQAHPETPRTGHHLYPTIYPTTSIAEEALELDHYNSTFRDRKPSNFSSSLYDYLDADLYVPHTIGSARIMKGDLIDLDDPLSTTEDNGTALTVEQIRREFDPLYRVTPDKDAVAMPPAPTNRQEIDYTVPAIRSLPIISKEDEDKENIAEKGLTIEDLVFYPTVPATFQQIEKLKESGRRNCSESSLFFQAPTADYATTNVSSIKVVIQTDHTWPSRETRSFVFDPETTVDLITTQVLSALMNENETLQQYSVEDYGLKIFGLDEFLPPSSQLGHSVYVGQCLLHGIDVKLEIGKMVASKGRNLHHPHWDQMKSQVKYLSALDREDIENVKSRLADSMRSYENCYYYGTMQGKNGVEPCFNLIKGNFAVAVDALGEAVSQQIKVLCEHLNSIEPCYVQEALQRYLSPKSADTLSKARNDLITALHSFIYVYCKSTMSTVQLRPVYPERTKTVEIIQCEDRLKIMVNSLHNLPVDWTRNYLEFDVSVNVYHGTRLMDTHSNSTSRSISPQGFFPCVPMNFCVAFPHQLCLCPRETKIMFILYGTLLPQNNTDPNRLETKKCLAYGTVPLFDHQMLMQQGQLFIPLTIMKDPVLKPWGPHPLISKKNDPVLIITFPTFGYQVQFPDVSIEFQSVKQDLFALSTDIQSALMDIIETGETQKLTIEEQELLWQKRSHLMDQPEALPLVLNSVTDWGYCFLSNVYQILEEWTPLSPVQAMQLLLPQYPDVRVRQKAVEWIMTASSDFLYNALPQLVEALRFELFESSSLAIALLTLSYKDRRFAFEIYWQLQQRIDHCVDYSYAQRCSLLQKELLDRHASDDLRSEIALQHKLLSDLDCLQMELKMENGDDSRIQRFRSTMGVLDSELLHSNVHLPILPSFKCTGVSVHECSIFNSNAKPLKIVFRGLTKNYGIIHKSGDDMRQDALVLQMVGLMNDIWLAEGLDLRVVLFRCMPVGFKKGMAELVLSCSTLCDIQKELGMTGVFKDDVLTNWIIKHNGSEFAYKMALDNFTRSCAAWCVATYVLGIGDRHNDNILVTTAGHVFHIDFGKYMGDWQTAAGFKRDRVPFVFTVEMYHVINGGKSQQESYQTFIDYCCKAFNYIRRKHTVLSNILKIMACSDIAGVSMESLAFVEKNLMLDLTETDAVIQFTVLINASLRSAFPRLNFFIHTLAQMMSGHAPKDNQNMLSFVPQVYTEKEDGRIKDVKVMSYEKRMMPQKVYLYKTQVIRKDSTVPTVVFRTFEEYNELYIKLRRRFASVVFPILSGGTRVRTNVAEVAQRRMVQIQQFLNHLFSLSAEIAHCDLVYTFFHLILRDNNIDNYSFNNEEFIDNNRQDCQIYVKIQFNRIKHILSIFIGHAKYLALLSSNQPPDAYVKTYIAPDIQKKSKRKTPVVKSSQNPTFNSELTYHLSADEAEHILFKNLEISIWNSSSSTNHMMYMTYLPLNRLKSKGIVEDRKGVRTYADWLTLERT